MSSFGRDNFPGRPALPIHADARDRRAAPIGSERGGDHGRAPAKDRNDTPEGRARNRRVELARLH
jgi:hypothetical protein